MSAHGRPGAPETRIHVRMMLSPMPGDCGICASAGIFFYVDIDLKALVCAECLNETRMAEIQLRAAGLEWPDGRIKEANP